MSRCGCSQECSCIVTSGDCTTVAGDGRPSAPYRVSVKVDDDADNRLSCSEDGLFVPPADVVTGATNCINLTGDGSPTDPILAHPSIYPSPENLLECTDSGLEAKVHTSNTNCISSVGAGTLADPVEISLNISPDSGNTAQCRPNGVFVPTASAGAVDIYGGMQLLAPFVTSGSTPSVLHSPWPYDDTLYDFGGIVDIANSRFVIPADGWYYVEAQWENNALANNYENSLTSKFAQLTFGVVFSGMKTPFLPGPLDTQDQLVNYRHAFRLSCLRYLELGDTVEFYWEMVNTAGGAIAPMDFNPSPPPVGESQPNYATIARIGV